MHAAACMAYRDIHIAPNCSLTGDKKYYRGIQHYNIILVMNNNIMLTVYLKLPFLKFVIEVVPNQKQEEMFELACATQYSKY